jgi:hypothetical protein
MNTPAPAQYRIGALRVPFFAACGDQREIIAPNGHLLAVVPQTSVAQIVDELNMLLTALRKHIPGEVPR